MIIALKTDSPTAELYLLDGEIQLDQETWQAHRELSDTLLERIEQLLERNNCSRQDVRGIVVFQGPGSFTGLRIGITVANTLAYAWGIPITAAQGEDWLQAGRAALQDTQDPTVVTPEYGAPARITQPRK